MATVKPGDLGTVATFDASRNAISGLCIVFGVKVPNKAGYPYFWDKASQVVWNKAAPLPLLLNHDPDWKLGYVARLSKVKAGWYTTCRLVVEPPGSKGGVPWPWFLSTLQRKGLLYFSPGWLPTADPHVPNRMRTSTITEISLTAAPGFGIGQEGRFTQALSAVLERAGQNGRKGK